MKPTTIAFLLLLPMLLSSQPQKMKFNYRPAPKTGEWLCIAGVGMVALSATVLHTECKPEVGKMAGYLGGAVIMAGVVVDLNGKGRKGVRYKAKKGNFRVRVRL